MLDGPPISQGVTKDCTFVAPCFFLNYLKARGFKNKNPKTVNFSGRLKDFFSFKLEMLTVTNTSKPL